MILEVCPGIACRKKECAVLTFLYYVKNLCSIYVTKFPFEYEHHTAHSLLRQAIPGQTSTITDIAITTVFVTFPLDFLGF